MSIAFLVNNDCIIEKIIEIPDHKDEDACFFINNELNLEGVWISEKSILNNIRPGIGMSYDPSSKFIGSKKPYNSWILDSSGDWKAPKNNNLRNPAFSYDNENQKSGLFAWDEDRLEWKHAWSTSFFEKENTMESGVFFVLKCIDGQSYNYISDAKNYLNVACNPQVNDYLEVHPDWNGPSFIDPLYQSGGYAESFGFSHLNRYSAYGSQDFKIIYDGAPHFMIAYQRLIDLNEYPYDPQNPGPRPSCIELEHLYIKHHPHIAARTLGELFKLIIEWDQAHHYLENDENIAKLAHGVLSAIDMPHDIYNSIKSMPDSFIRRYINNHANALELGEKPITPPTVVEWFKEKYWDLSHKKTHEIFNVDPNANSHYYCD